MIRRQSSLCTDVPLPPLALQKPRVCSEARVYCYGSDIPALHTSGSIRRCIDDLPMFHFDGLRRPPSICTRGVISIWYPKPLLQGNICRVSIQETLDNSGGRLDQEVTGDLGLGDDAQTREQDASDECQHAHGELHVGACRGRPHSRNAGGEVNI